MAEPEPEAGSFSISSRALAAFLSSSVTALTSHIFLPRCFPDTSGKAFGRFTYDQHWGEGAGSWDLGEVNGVQDSGGTWREGL